MLQICLFHLYYFNKSKNNYNYYYNNFCNFKSLNPFILRNTNFCFIVFILFKKSYVTITYIAFILKFCFKSVFSTIF